MSTVPERFNSTSESFPIVKGRCPACGWKSLFLGSGGYVTCSRLDCPDPCAAGDLLDRVVETSNRKYQERRRGSDD